MSASKKGLGRGFETLIPTDFLDESFDPTSDADNKVSDLRTIPTTDIYADPDQPRREFDQEGLDELAASIKEHGILQPIVVTVRKGGGYMIVAGERRWRAAQLANLEKMPALVRTLTGQHKLELSLIENIQRRDLNPIETAMAYVKLQDEFNLTHAEIGQRVGGKSSAAIMNCIRLLKLPKPVIDALVRGDLTEGNARPLVGMHEDDILEVLPKIIEESWSARRIEQVAREMKAVRRTGDMKPSPKSPRTTQALRYVNEMKRLEKRFDTAVKITSSNRGSGKVVIPFKDDEQFQKIVALLEENQ